MMTCARLCSISALVLALGCNLSRGLPGTDAGNPAMLSDGAAPPPDTDGGPPAAGSLPPGSACDCDSECEGTSANAGLCVNGVCMTRATGACATAGASTGCPAGSRCWGLEGVSGGVCWPDCESFSCAGSCDSDGSCVPTDSTDCNESCSEICSGGGNGNCPENSHLSKDGAGCVCDEGFVVNAEQTACVRECTTDADCGAELVCVDNSCRTPPCTPSSCPSGTICAASGDCVVDIGTPPTGPPPAECQIGSMGIPDWRCTTDCASLVAFDPRRASGYWDYLINGETETNQYRSFVRRDVMMLVRYATAMVACQGGSWAGNGGDLGLGDMSEADGSIPGTSIGEPGHPAGTHVNGHDMDIAYFQIGTADNTLRPVCPHTSGGTDQYHCTGDPVNLDPWRTALFLGHLHANPNLRVVGVDGRVGPLVESALSQLCAGGWVTGQACSSHAVTWEATDEGRGWYVFHHHHLHISVSGT